MNRVCSSNPFLHRVVIFEPLMQNVLKRRQGTHSTLIKCVFRMAIGRLRTGRGRLQRCVHLATDSWLQVSTSTGLDY